MVNRLCLHNTNGQSSIRIFIYQQKLNTLGKYFHLNCYHLITRNENKPLEAFYNIIAYGASCMVTTASVPVGYGYPGTRRRVYRSFAPLLQNSFRSLRRPYHWVVWPKYSSYLMLFRGKGAKLPQTPVGYAAPVEDCFQQLPVYFNMTKYPFESGMIVECV